MKEIKFFYLEERLLRLLLRKTGYISLKKYIGIVAERLPFTP